MMERVWSGGIWGIGLTLLIVVLLFPVAAVGQPVAIQVEVSGSGPGYATIYSGIDWDDVYANPGEIHSWWMEAPLDIAMENEPDTILATIDGMAISVRADPLIELGFAVTAGKNDTSFSFSSEVLTIEPGLINAEAWAAASVTVGMGDTLTGGYDLKAYRSLYNGSTVFADLVDPATWPGGSEFTASQAIPGVVTSMQAKWQFILSAEGIASGSSNFEITGDVIPEPASILLLGLGGLALLRKRRI